MNELKLKAAVFAAKLISSFMPLTILATLQSQVEVYGHMKIAVIAAFFCLTIGAYVVAADKLELNESFQFTALLHIATAIVAFARC